MSHGNDDDEIEQHLLDRIKHAIDNPGENKNLVTKFVSVKSEFDELRTMLTETKNQTHKDDWLSIRRENLYYLNNLLTEWQIIKDQSSFFSKESYDSRENIKKILKKMKKELSGEESKPGDDSDKSRSHHQVPNHTIFERNKEEVYRWSSRYPPRKIHGFEHIAMAVERDLVMRDLDAPFKVFGVVGVAGIGKTTLCQKIFGRSLVKNHFSPRIWVCLSKQQRNNDQPNKEIVVRILENLGIEDEVITDVADGSDPLRRLILLLRLQLIGKRYLIVLDDAWDHNDFFLNLTRKPQLDDNWGEELAYALPKGCGGTIISSSRSEALLKKMIGKDANLQHLKPHTNEIIEEIFKDTVIGYDEDQREFPQHLEDLKGGILKKCEGIPLAAKLLAKIAREQLPVKPQPVPVTTAGGRHENRPVSSGGAEQLKGGGDAGGGGTGIQDGERKGDFLQKSKHKNGLVPVPSDPVA